MTWATSKSRRDFCSKLAREAGRLTGWREKIFSRRYQAILISEEEAAQVERLNYLLSQGAKENLLSRPQDWPGVHCVNVEAIVATAETRRKESGREPAGAEVIRSQNPLGQPAKTKRSPPVLQSVVAKALRRATPGIV